MTRRKKDPPKPGSTNWETYRPHDALYWKFGGPLIPIDEIEPLKYDASQSYRNQRPEYRSRLLAEALESAEKDLAEQSTYYLQLAEQGIDAMKFGWYRDQDRKMDAQPDMWRMAARNVDRHRASSYSSIAFRKGQIIGLRDAIAQIESEALPLLFVGGKNRVL